MFERNGRMARALDELQLLDGNLLYITAVDVDLECLHDVGLVPVPDDKEQLVLVSLGQTELAVERLVGKHVLIDLVAILVLYGQEELASIRVCVRHIEYKHVVLDTEVFHDGSILLWIDYRISRLGMNTHSDHQEKEYGGKLADCGGE